MVPPGTSSKAKPASSDAIAFAVWLVLFLLLSRRFFLPVFNWIVLARGYQSSQTSGCLMFDSLSFPLPFWRPSR